MPDMHAAFDTWRQDVSWTASQDANHRLVYEAYCAGWDAGRAAAPDDDSEQVVRLMAVAAEAHRDGYENGRADEREACARLAEQRRFIHFAGMIRAQQAYAASTGGAP